MKKIMNVKNFGKSGSSIVGKSAPFASVNDSKPPIEDKEKKIKSYEKSITILSKNEKLRAKFASSFLEAISGRYKPDDVDPEGLWFTLEEKYGSRMLKLNPTALAYAFVLKISCKNKDNFKKCYDKLVKELIQKIKTNKTSSILSLTKDDKRAIAESLARYYRMINASEKWK